MGRRQLPATAKLFLAFVAIVLLLNVVFVWILSATIYPTREGQPRPSAEHSRDNHDKEKEPVVWISAKKVRRN